jgi:LysM domain
MAQVVAVPRAVGVRRGAGGYADGSPADLHLTRRGRRVLWTVAIVSMFVALLLGGRAMAGVPSSPQEVEPYTVAQGETLWGIAATILLPGEDPRDVFDLIVEVNGRESVALWAGEQILLPVR